MEDTEGTPKRFCHKSPVLRSVDKNCTQCLHCGKTFSESPTISYMNFTKAAEVPTEMCGVNLGTVHNVF